MILRLLTKISAYEELKDIDRDELVNKRYNKFRNMGEYKISDQRRKDDKDVIKE